MSMTCLWEPKVETPEALEVDNLPEVETLLEEMILVIPVLLCPIVMDPMPHPLIRETSLVVASATGVEKRRTSTVTGAPYTEVNSKVATAPNTQSRR